MKRLLLLAFCVASTVLLATALAGGKGGPQKNFSVTIENTMSDGFTPTTIRSDGLGSYINGVDGVSVGSTFINMWPRTDLGSRNVSIDNGGVYPSRNNLPSPNDFLAPPTGMTGTGNLLEDPHGGGPIISTSMENMAIGSAGRQCGSFYWVVTDSNTGSGWRVPSYRFNLANVPESSYVVVTRNSSTQWTVESDHEGVCGQSQDVGMVLHGVTSSGRGKNTTITYADGYYYVPFRLTYTLE